MQLMGKAAAKKDRSSIKVQGNQSYVNRNFGFFLGGERKIIYGMEGESREECD